MDSEGIVSHIYLSSKYGETSYQKNKPSSFINRFDGHLNFNPAKLHKLSLVSMYYDKAKDIQIDLQPLLITCNIISRSQNGIYTVPILKKVYPKNNWEQTLNGAITPEYHPIIRSYVPEISVDIYNDNMKLVSFPEGTLYMTLEVHTEK